MKRFKDVVFTIFDLEWNTYEKSTYIIEIGAIKIQNGRVIEEFDKVIRCDKPLDPIVTELTGITENELKCGEKRDEVLLQFHIFIEDTVLVAHDINNDIRTLENEFPDVENLKICTFKLAQKSFLLEKYNLKSISDFFGFEVKEKHRGYQDALLSYKIFSKIVEDLPEDILDVEKIMSWNRRKKKLKSIEIEEIDLEDKQYYGFFDGASLGNPGDMGVGFAIAEGDGRVVHKRGEYIGVGTNNEAEYMALIYLLETAVKSGVQKLRVFGDSSLVVKQVNGEWKIKAEHLKPFQKRAKEFLSQIPNSELIWIKREKNSLADSLSKIGAEKSGNI